MGYIKTYDYYKVRLLSFLTFSLYYVHVYAQMVRDVNFLEKTLLKDSIHDDLKFSKGLMSSISIMMGALVVFIFGTRIARIVTRNAGVASFYMSTYFFVVVFVGLIVCLIGLGYWLSKGRALGYRLVDIATEIGIDKSDNITKQNIFQLYNNESDLERRYIKLRKLSKNEQSRFHMFNTLASYYNSQIST